MFIQSKKIIFILLATIVTLVYLYSAYVYNYVVFRQARNYITTIGTVENINKFIIETDKFLKPYNYSQSTIRAQLMDFLGGQNIFENQHSIFVNLGDKSIKAMQKVVDRGEIDPRNYIRLSEAYNDRAEMNPDYFQKSEEVLRKALKLAPTRQEVYYHLAFTLAGAGKNEEAIEVARQAVDLAPEVARAHYMLGVILSVSGKRVEGEQAIEKALSMERGLFFLGQDSKNILEIYGENFIFHVKQRDLAGIERTVSRLKQFEPNKEAVFVWDKLLKMAREGKWVKLENTVNEIVNKNR